MSSALLTDLAPELLHAIFQHLHSISDVLALSSTCRDIHNLLSPAQRLPILFAAAECSLGPLEDITQLLTYNASQPAHVMRQPQQSYALLRQIVSVGRIGNKIVELYPQYRWGDDRFLERRGLTSRERRRVRRAVYRYWLYCAAFQNRTYGRSCRMMSSVMEERATLLRNWNTADLIEVEDLRIVLEEIVSSEICPTDGAVMRNFNEHCDFRVQNKFDAAAQTFYQQRSWNSWPPDTFTRRVLPDSLFHCHRVETVHKEQDELPVQQRRKVAMSGWGDEIGQYYVVQSMMKLDPRRIVGLYEKAVTKGDVEKYVVEECDGGEWFWDNGQTWLDTWSLVLYKRGEDVSRLRGAILDGEQGIACTNAIDLQG